MTKKYHIYIAECTPDGGITHAEINESGIITTKETTPCDRPMYLSEESGKMYVLLREPYENSPFSGLTSFDVNSDGSLGKQSEIISTKGKVACHLAVFGEDIYAVNYVSGSVIKFPDTLIQHSGHGPNIKRQDAPHTHFVCRTPDKKYICVNDLGADKIFVYDKNLVKRSEVVMPSGCGPRHLAFSDDGKTAFCVNELSSTVTVLDYCDGGFTVLSSYNALPEGFSEANTAAAIRRDGDMLYVSNRGADTICVFKIKGKNLEKVTEFDCRGKSPRDLNIIGDYIVCTNQDSDNVTVFNKKDNYKYVCEIPAKSPLCVVFSEY